MPKMKEKEKRKEEVNNYDEQNGKLRKFPQTSSFVNFKHAIINFSIYPLKEYIKQLYHDTEKGLLNELLEKEIVFVAAQKLYDWSSYTVA